MADYGIKVSQDGVDARTATDAQLLLNMKYPIAKLDTTNPVSFQNFTITFVTDPPEPALDSNNTTLIYRFAHGYNYVPQMWSLINVVTPPASRSILQPYAQDANLLANVTPADTAVMRVRADATYINITVDKSRTSLPGNGPNPLPGLVVKLRIYVFVQDVSS